MASSTMKGILTKIRCSNASLPSALSPSPLLSRRGCATLSTPLYTPGCNPPTASQGLCRTSSALVRSSPILRAHRMRCISTVSPLFEAYPQAFQLKDTAPMSDYLTVLQHTGTGKVLLCTTPTQMKKARDAMDMHTITVASRRATVGFVPTMGALHEGHLALLSAANNPNVLPDVAHYPAPADFLVTSVFVNPTQFAPTEDLASYPRTLASDLIKLQANGVHVVFAPSAASMYPQPAAADPIVPAHRTFVNMTYIDELTPEGRARPGFFRGVATVVTKLFGCVRPTHAVFGQKDGIQCIVIRTLVRELNLPVDVFISPTVREKDGLAMSSRNVYLNPRQRSVAPAIFNALEYVRGALAELPSSPASPATRKSEPVALKEAELAAQRSAQLAGSSIQLPPPPSIAPALRPILEKASSIILEARPVEGGGGAEDWFSEIQYMTLSDAATGRPIGDVNASLARNGAVMLSLVAKIGRTRLLDNMMVVGFVQDLGRYA